ncbi:MAG: hypothetical protein KC800_30530 [Candidatus Eremiobacteraeota bacterium]|nr:hypothetical protein [Candidatus Eremiobacteraeota bacterium]
MQIRSTQRPTLASGFPRQGLTAKGQLDRQLAEGQTDVVDLGVSRTDLAKKQVNNEFKFAAIHHGVLSGAVGLAMANMSPVGAVAGLGLGAYIAWNRTSRKTSGSVTVNLDGETRKTRYYGRPENYVKTPQEVRAEMIARGQLGERIKPFTPESSDLSTEELKWSSQDQKSLKDLEKERRLVADLGQRSEYGFDVLNQVDAITAARLMKADKPVFLVDGRSSDMTHTLDVSAFNNRSTVRRHDSDSYLERTYEYALTPLTKEVLAEQGLEGQGLPEGFHGVYKNAGSCALVMGEDEQAGLGVTGKNYRHTSFSNRRVTRDQSIDLGSRDKARVITTASVNVRDVIMMGGVLAGMLTGMGLAPGAPQAALIGGVTGGVLGRELGWLAQDRMPSHQTY